MEDLPYTQRENQTFGSGSSLGRSSRDVYEQIYSTKRQRELGISGESTSLWDIASQFGGGFLQGFTTINFGEEPKTTTEAIANSLGNVFGFMGVIPGFGTVGSTAASALGKGLRLTARTAGLSTKAARYGTKVRKGLSGFRSVPMAAGDAVLKGAKAVGKTKAAGAAMKYLRQSPTLAKQFGKAGLGRDIAKGYLQMGTAGAVSAWQGGVDQMMEAFIYTGALGSADRVAGNLIPHKGPGTPDLSTLLKGGDDAARMAARGLSVGMFQGGLATARGAPLEMQVYEYLLGAWFGGKEVSRQQRRAFEFLKDSGMYDPIKRAENVGRAQRQALEKMQQAKNAELRFAETLPGYDDLRSDVQEYVDLESEAQFGRFMMMPDSPKAQEEGIGGAMEGTVAAARAVRETLQRMEEEGRSDAEILAYINAYREAEAESARQYQAQKQQAAEQRAQEQGTDTSSTDTSSTDTSSTDTPSDEGPSQDPLERIEPLYDQDQSLTWGKKRLDELIENNPDLQSANIENIKDASREELENLIRSTVVMLKNRRVQRGERAVEKTVETARKGQEGESLGGDNLAAQLPSAMSALRELRRRQESTTDGGESTTGGKESTTSGEEATTGGEDAPSPLDLNIFLQQAGMRARQETDAQLDAPAREVQRAIKDHNIPTELASPVMQFSRRVFEGNENFDPAPEKFFVETLTTAKQKYEEKGVEGFDDFVSTVKNRYGIDIDEGARQELRSQWLRAAHQEPEAQRTLDLTGEGRPSIEKRAPVDENGQRTARARSPSHMERTVGRRAALETVRVEVGPGDIDPNSGFERPDDAPTETVETGIYDAIEHGYLNVSDLTRMAEENGFIIAGGVKDKGRLVLVEAEMNPEEAMAYIREQRKKMKEVDNRMGEASDRVTQDEVWEQNYQDFAERRGLNPESQSTRRRYAYHWANSARMFERMNGGMEWAEMYRAERSEDGGSFMLGDGVTEFNKRMQVMDAGDIPVKNEAWSDIEDVSTESVDELLRKQGYNDEEIQAIKDADTQSEYAKIVEEKIGRTFGEENIYEGKKSEEIARAMAQEVGIPQEDAVGPRQKMSHAEATAFAVNKRVEDIQRALDRAEGGGLRISLINSIPSGADGGSGLKYQVEGEDLITFLKRNDRGEVVRDIHDQHMDGVYFLRDDVFEALARYGGWATDTGAQKGITTQADENGLLLGKYAYHRAGPELSKAMGDTHGLMTSEAAKQTGTRTVYDMRFTRDGELKFYREGSTRPTDPETYTIEDGNMTISQGTGEKSGYKNVRLPMQLSGNFNVYQALEGAESAYENFHRPGFEGEEAHNERVSTYKDLIVERALDETTDERAAEIDKSLEEMAQKLDPEKVGVQQMIDFFNAPIQSDNPVFEKMARHILDLDPKDMMSQAFNSKRVEQAMKRLTEQRSAANIITQAVDRITPAIVDHKLVRPYFQSALRGYLVTKTVRPKVEHSWKSILAPYHSNLRRDNDLGRNDFLLHEGMRGKKVQFGEETIPLGEAWERFQDAGGWESAPVEMQKDMKMAAMRAPSDSMSGTQPLKFRGFTGTEGYGAVLHPKTMEYLGGADLDIDSAFFFQNLPEDMMRGIEKNKYEWETLDEQGRLVLQESKNKDEDFVKQFSDDPEENARLAAIQQHPISMNDPAQRIEAGMGANRGNKLLGYGLNAAKRWHVIHEESQSGRVSGEADADVAQDLPERMRSKLRSADAAVEAIKWTGYLKDDQAATIRSYKRDIVNYAADAANYAGLISRFKIADLVGRRSMDRITVRAELRPERDDGQTIDPEAVDPSVRAEVGNGQTIHLGTLDPSTELPFSVSKNDQYRALSKADKFLKGKNYQEGTAYSLKEVIDGLRNVRSDLPAGVTNSWYRLARDFGRLNADEQFRIIESAKLKEGQMAVPPWLGDQYINFKQVFDNVWAEETALAKVARQLLLRRDLKVFTENRGEHPAQKYKAAKEEGPVTPITRATNDTEAEQIKDFPVNDLTDVATAIEGVRIGRKMIEKYGKEEAIQRAQELVQAAAKLRQKAARLLGRADAKKERQEAAPSREDTLQDVIEEARGVVKGLGSLEQEFFETYLIGSLTPQERGLKSSRGPSGRSRREILAEMREVRPKAEAGDQDAQKRLAELTREKEENRKAFYKTNQTGSSFLLGVVRDDTVAQFMNRYNEVVQATRKDELSKADVREAAQRGESMDRLATKTEAVEAVSGGTKAEAEAETWTREVFDQIAPELARADGELSERGTKIKERLKTLFYNNPRLMKNFGSAAPGLVSEVRGSDVGTATEDFTLADLEQYVSFFDQVGKHDYWGMSEEEREELPLPLKKRHYFLFPEYFDKMHLPFDRGAVTLEKPVATSEGVRKGEVKIYLSKMGQMHRFWKQTYRHIDQQTNAEAGRLLRQFEFIESLGREGEILWDAAVAQRERRGEAQREEDGHYEQQYQRAMKRLRDKGLDKKKFKVKVDGELRELTGEQIISHVNDKVTQWAQKMYEKYVENPQGESFLVYKDGNEHLPPEEREIDVRQTMANINRAVIKGSDPPMLGFNTLSRISHQYLLDKTEVKVDQGDGTFTTVRLGDIEDPQLRLKKRSDLLKGRPELQFEKTQQRDPTRYWPHNGHPKEAVRKAIERQIKKAAAEGASEVQKDQIEMNLKAQAQQLNAPDQGALSPERAEQMDRRSITVEDVETRGLKYKPGHLKSRGRFGDETLPNYRRDIGALSTYQQQIINAHHKMTADLMSRTAIESFRRQEPMGEYTDAWANFMQIYNRDQIGFPSVFPDEWLRDPKQSLGTSEEEQVNLGFAAVASNPYYWFTDDSIQRKAKWIGKKLGFDGDARQERREKERRAQIAEAKRNARQSGEDPEAAAQKVRESFAGQTKREVREQLSGAQLLGSYFHDGEYVSQKVRAFSQWEGKWQLMSLLAHTKSYINNIFGGNVHTVISSGMKPWRKAKDIGYLRNVAGLDIESKEGARKFVEQKIGGVENYIVNEVNMSRAFRTDKMKNFADDVVRALKKNPELEDATLAEMAKRRGLSDTILNGAAFFMRKSERQLRTRSALAHYAKAQETLGMGGSAFKPDHPWLIRQAKKGVNATQFLYHNASRPAFSRTPLGRIFSRFQLFTWNSLRFRKRIFSRARNAGYEVPEGPSIPYGQGPENYQKLQRLAMADLFMLGLASLFPYSLFESSVPPHLEWGRDAAAVAFGDEQSRERAFFGTGKLGPLAPLQAIQPPSTRILQPMFIAMMEDDWSRFVNYHIPTLMPFGRLSRNIYRTYKNPIRVGEEMMGLPVIDAQRKLRKLRKRDHYPRPYQINPQENP